MGSLKHGHARGSHGTLRTTAEYRAWNAMKTRCLNPNQDRYEDYGGRGITICRRWLKGTADLSAFECFLADVGLRPSPDHSIHRIKTNKNYTPKNTRWATRSEQARHTRLTRYVSIDGERLCFADAVEKHASVSVHTVHQRIHRGWPVKKAILTARAA